MLPPPGTIASSRRRRRRRAPRAAIATHALRVGAVVEVAHQRLAGELQQDPLEDRRGPSRAAYSPTTKRAKRRITTFSPVVAAIWCCELADRLAVVLVGVDVRLVEQHDLAEYHFASLPSAILRADLLGLVGGLLLEDAQLGVARLVGDLLAADPARRRGRDVRARPRARTRRSRRCGRRSRSRSRPRRARRPSRCGARRSGSCPRRRRGSPRSSIRLPCLTRSSSIALSTSPSASVSARLQSIIPAPVRSRRALTSAAVISATRAAPPPVASGLRAPLGAACGRLRPPAASGSAAAGGCGARGGSAAASAGGGRWLVGRGRGAARRSRRCGGGGGRRCGGAAGALGRGCGAAALLRPPSAAAALRRRRLRRCGGGGGLGLGRGGGCRGGRGGLLGLAARALLGLAAGALLGLGAQALLLGAVDAGALRRRSRRSRAR